MPTNDFLAFSTAGGAPVLSQADYAASTPANGRGPGILPKEAYNKIARQPAALAAAIGEFIKLEGFNALDDGNIPGLRDSFIAALGAFFAAMSTGGGGLTVSDFTGANQSLAPNGFQKFPGGLILQWGSYLYDPTSGSGSASFPIAFPAACYIVMQEPVTDGAITTHAIGSKSTTGFSSVLAPISSAHPTHTMLFFSVGK